ncbi:hypothetical protein FNV43_RR17920 [Rhamnella rubrinervis]|uniref:U1-type domain-containing protein n=1 Tax=Rhamnella rubrinervis TaxID=2594499 RepID=A0A8K0EAB7_9ROSA|nr:hypothetical protein FNV43_RR17920 [Rhamnella rubrinervis]
MVWFQCEDCGDNLKKPKLLNHFKMCSATKLSCIDCGQTFGQQSVQGHTQCITEAEKYGPKGEGKPLNGVIPEPNKDAKKQTDFDINVGLSERPPWFCSLCNTKATSKQTLLLHAEGKKHKGKARAFHAAKQPKQIEESAQDTKLSSENSSKGELVDDKGVEEPKVQDASNVDVGHTNFESENGNFPLKKKRKFDEDVSLRKKVKDDTVGELGNGEVIQGGKTEAADKESQLKRQKVAEPGSADDQFKKIKWKKLIISALKSNPEGVLKMKKLRKLVHKALRESGITQDEAQLGSVLEHKINSSSRFNVESKYVRLIAKD